MSNSDGVRSVGHARVMKYSPETVAAIAKQHGIKAEQVTAEHLEGVEPDEITEGTK